MVRRIEWDDFNLDGEDLLGAVAGGGTVEITRGDEVVALLSAPPVRGMTPLRVRKARSRGGFQGIVGVRPSRPTAELLDRLRGQP